MRINTAVPVSLLRLPRRWLARLRPYRPIETTRSQWDVEFAEGRWSYLADLDEMARYSVIAGYCQQLKPGGRILDVACGQGVLLDRLDRNKFSRYVGIDISSSSVSRQSNRTAQADFLVADVSAYVPRALPWDVIVFNECLYYFTDPLGVTGRYRAILEAGGIFVVSMHLTVETRKMWRALDAAYAQLDAVTVTHGSQVSWIVKVYRP